MIRYNIVAALMLIVAVAFVSVTTAAPVVTAPAATVNAGTSVTDSLQSVVDSIFAAQNVGQQIDSAAVSTVKALAESYRQAGMSDRFWQYRKAAVKLERQADKSLPSVTTPVIECKRHKLSSI